MVFSDNASNEIPDKNLKTLSLVGKKSFLFHEYLSFTGLVDGDSWVKSLSGLLLKRKNNDAHKIFDEPSICLIFSNKQINLMFKGNW